MNDQQNLYPWPTIITFKSFKKIVAKQLQRHACLFKKGSRPMKQLLSTRKER